MRAALIQRFSLITSHQGWFALTTSKHMESQQVAERGNRKSRLKYKIKTALLHQRHKQESYGWSASNSRSSQEPEVLVLMCKDSYKHTRQSVDFPQKKSLQGHHSSALDSRKSRLNYNRVR